ncbi:MAG: alpha/beta hydrolase [Pseudomonadota bacterium]
MQPHLVQANGINLALYEEGEGFPVVLCHGWPDLAHAWKNQLPALAAAGFRAIAPDQRGYGLSDAPAEVEAYDIHRLTDDMAGLLDALDLERAVFAGHDWGGIVVWHMAMLHPDRVAGVIGVNTPHIARPAFDPMEIFIAAAGPNHYWAEHQPPGKAEAVYGADVEKFVQYFFRPPPDIAMTPPPEAYHFLLNLPKFKGAPADSLVMPEEDYRFHVETYKRTGFTGGLNWYRNSKRNWELMESVDHHIDKPALMITAELDIFSKPEFADGMAALVPDLETHMIKGCGHWTTWEKPKELNALMADWLARRFG